MLQILLVLALIPLAMFGVWLLKNLSLVLYKKLGGKTLGLTALAVLIIAGVLLYFPGF